jgi:hypothetical protein
MDAPDKGSLRDSVADKTAKRVAKQERDAENKAQREEGTFNNKLLIERDVAGLYFVRWVEGGALPEVLKDKFTSIRRIENVILGKYGSLDIIAK